ncbi:MAG: M4 family metallopeptidase [Arenimonas sp.]
MSLSRTTLSFAILMSLAGTAAAANTQHPAAQRALDLVKANGAAARVAAGDAFVVKDVRIDANGTEHVRFDRTYRGLAVIGGDFVVHSRNGNAQGVSQTLTTSARPSLKPAVSADQAIIEAGANFGLAFTNLPSARQVIYARGAQPALAYQVSLNGTKKDGTPSEMLYFVDARSGKILDQWDQVHTAASPGTGNTITLGTVTLTTNSVTGGYELKDPTRGNGFTLDANNAATTTTTGTNVIDSDNVWGDGTNSDRKSAEAEAHYGVAMTWDYFKNVHARNGISNNGTGAKSLVHVGSNWVNASWSGSCFCMRYGDGDGTTYRPLTVLDVAGHEMAHGVTGATSGLAYSGDAGGLNEGTSDIFGTLVEFYANNAADAGDYLVGEKIYINNPTGTKALRVMFKQNIDGVSFVCYPSRGFKNSPAHDPHYTSGIANRFFYLLAEGAVVPAGFGAGTSYNLTPSSLVCNGNTALNAIGRTKAGAIWYRALDLYFTSSTTYPQARAHTIKAATDLYGAGSAEVAAVAAAWSSTAVN